MYETLEQLKNVVQIPIWKISRTEQTMGRGDPKRDPEIETLVRNIKNQGLLNPITVAVIRGTEANEETKRYTIVAGNRRYEAVRRLNYETIKSFVLPFGMSATEHEMLTLSENMLRKNYSPHERAKIIAIMLENWAGDKAAVAKALGYSSPKVVDNWLAPMNLDSAVIDILKGDPETKAKRSTLIARLPRQHQQIAAEILNEKNPSNHDASKIITAIRQNPEEPPREVVDRLDNLPRTTSMIIYLDKNVNAAFEYACTDLGKSKPRLAEKIIEDFLTKEGYFDKAKNRISSTSTSNQ